MKITVPMVGTIALFALSNCDPGDEPQAASELLAEIETNQDFSVQFRTSEDGSLIISEEGPLQYPSLVAHFAEANEATPLEIFSALAPDREPPLALQRHHAESGKASPRALTVPRFDFRGITGNESTQNCTLSSNGKLVLARYGHACSIGDNDDGKDSVSYHY